MKPPVARARLIALLSLFATTFDLPLVADALCPVTNFPASDAGGYNRIDVVTPVGDRFLLRASAPGLASGLWATDGTQSGTIALAAASERPLEAVWLKDREGPSSVILHSNVLGQVDGGLSWRSDGTPEGTWRIVDRAGAPFLLWSVFDLGGRPHTIRCEENRCQLYEVRNERVAVPVLNLPPGYPGSVTAFGDTGLVWIDQQLWRFRPGAAPEDLGLRTFEYVPSASTPSRAVLWLRNEEGHGTLFSVGRSGPAVALLTDPGGLENPQLPSLRILRGRIYLVFDDRQHGAELWSTDGTAEGTRRETNFLPAQPFEDLNLGEAPFGLVVFANDGQGSRLFRLNGAGAAEPLQASCGSTCSRLREFDAFSSLTLGSRWVFNSFDPATGLEPWVSDGTKQGTKILKDFCPGPCAGGYLLGGTSSVALLSVRSGTTREIWTSDGTSQGSHKLADLPPGADSVRWLPTAATLTATPPGSNELHFLKVGDGTSHWRVVRVPRFGWGQAIVRPEVVGETVTFLTSGGDYLAVDLKGRLSSPSGPRRGCPYFDPNGEWAYAGCRPRLALGGITYFVDGASLWQTDGTPTGLKRVAQGIQYDGSYLGLQPWQGGLAWLGGQSLWVSDGTAAGTRRLLDWRGEFEITVGPFPGRTSDELLFQARVPGSEGISNLWRTDGTPAGTYRLTDYSSPQSWERPVIAGGAAYWFATPDPPWSNGGFSNLLRFPAGAAAPEFVAAFRDPGPILTLGKLGDRVVFTSRRGADFAHRTLWSVREAEVRPLKNYLPSRATTSFSEYLDADRMTLHDDKVFLVLSVGKTGRELWVTDGTAAGTRGLDLEPGGASSYPEDLRSTSRGLVFSASNATRGRELWSSDGTAAGTRRVADLNPGVPGAWPTPAAELAGRVYFGATTIEGATQLWLWTKGSCAKP